MARRRLRTSDTASSSPATPPRASTWMLRESLAPMKFFRYTWMGTHTMVSRLKPRERPWRGNRPMTRKGSPRSRRVLPRGSTPGNSSSFTSAPMTATLAAMSFSFSLK